MGSMNLRYSLVALMAQSWIAAGVAASAAAPSFDCSNATGPIEELICSNSDLAALDVQLAAAYKKDLTESAAEDKHDLIAMQRHWLGDRDSACEGNSDIRGCVNFQYVAQLGQLEQFMKDNVGGNTHVLYGGEIRRSEAGKAADGPSTFNSSIKQNGIKGRLVSCSMLMKLRATRIETGIGGNCILQDAEKKRQQVLVCNDTAVGRFKLIALDPQHKSKRDLAQFIADNCTGG
jgi:uncharacterized protein